MINIAVVEDEKKDSETIVNYINRYFSSLDPGKDKTEFKISSFDNVIIFLTNYKPIYDIVFMDIQMPHMNGMDAAVNLRKLDPAVQLIFITNMANFAVRGYSVDAADFIIKPVSYYNFSAMLTKILRIIKNKADEIVLRTTEGVKKIPVHTIAFVEVRDHLINYHTDGGDIEIWGTLKEQESKLPQGLFVRCNSCYLVNLKHVDEVEDDFVSVKGIKIPVSRLKKQKFVQKLLEYYGKNI